MFNYLQWRTQCIFWREPILSLPNSPPFLAFFIPFLPSLPQSGHLIAARESGVAPVVHTSGRAEPGRRTLFGVFRAEN